MVRRSMARPTFQNSPQTDRFLTGEQCANETRTHVHKRQIEQGREWRGFACTGTLRNHLGAKGFRVRCISAAGERVEWAGGLRVKKNLRVIIFPPPREYDWDDKEVGDRDPP